MLKASVARCPNLFCQMEQMTKVGRAEQAQNQQMLPLNKHKEIKRTLHRNQRQSAPPLMLTGPTLNLAPFRVPVCDWGSTSARPCAVVPPSLSFSSPSCPRPCFLNSFDRSLPGLWRCPKAVERTNRHSLHAGYFSQTHSLFKQAWNRGTYITKPHRLPVQHATAALTARLADIQAMDAVRCLSSLGIA